MCIQTYFHCQDTMNIITKYVIGPLSITSSVSTLTEIKISYCEMILFYYFFLMEAYIQKMLARSHLGIGCSEH